MPKRTQQHVTTKPEQPWIVATHKGTYQKLLLAAKPLRKAIRIVRPAVKPRIPTLPWEPLYLDYIFLKALSGSLRATVKHLPVHICCLGEKTLTISNAEMDRIMEITKLLAYQATHPPGAREFVQEHKGKQAEIIGGSACGMSGNVEEEAGKRDVFVRIAGVRIRVPMDRLKVEPSTATPTH